MAENTNRTATEQVPTAEQPMPVPSDLPSIQGMVRVDLAEREQVGIERYGTPLQAHNGRDALVDAYQEALDLACYLRQMLAERKPDREPTNAHPIGRLIEAVTGEPVGHVEVVGAPVSAPDSSPGFDRKAIEQFRDLLLAGDDPLQLDRLTRRGAGVQLNALLADLDQLAERYLSVWRQQRNVARAELDRVVAGKFGEQRDDAAPLPPGDGPGWDRETVEAFLNDGRVAATWTEVETQLRALLADRDRMCELVKVAVDAGAELVVEEQDKVARLEEELVGVRAELDRLRGGVAPGRP